MTAGEQHSKTQRQASQETGSDRRVERLPESWLPSLDRTAVPFSDIIMGKEEQRTRGPLNRERINEGFDPNAAALLS